MTTVCTRDSRRPLDPFSSGQCMSHGYSTSWWIARLESRRRTCQAAISSGDPHGGEEPEISEWESPPQLPCAMGNAPN